MPVPRLPADKERQIVAYLAEGKPASWIAGKVGVDKTTVYKVRNRNNAPAVNIEEVEQFQKAAEETEYAEFENPQLVWQRAEKETSYRIKKAAEQSDFHWTAPGKHVLISFISDQHIAPGSQCDLKAMREDAELIAGTQNCYAVLGGDAINNHIKHHAAMVNERSNPDDQYKLFEYYLRILGDKVLAGVTGNHEYWTKQRAGVDVVSRLFEQKRTFYCPHQCYLHFTVGGQTYRGGVRHQYRFNSSFNQTHSPKQWMRNGERELDFASVSHHHEAAIEQFLYRGKLCFAIRPGSYQIATAYSDQFGFNRSIPTSPTLLLRGDTKEMYGWQSLRAAIECVRAMRELGV